jgi:hypothetical protein
LFCPRFREKIEPDIVERVDKTGFMSIVAEAVAAVDWPGKGKPYTLAGGNAVASETLMTLMVYCYAIGVLASRDIERRCVDDATLKGLCGGDPPDEKMVGRFRKTHRQALKQCIAHICEQALRIRFGDAESEPPLADYYVALALDRWFEPLCVASPPDEAEERLGRASFIDGMSSCD